MKLIPEARKAHRMWSVRLALTAAVIAAMEPVLPHWQGLLPEWAYSSLVTLVALAAGVARVIPQSGLRDD